MCLQELNLESKNAFAERMLGYYNGAALTLMISIGHRTGLFDAMSALPGATSVQIAESAGLDERYVREWLGALTVGGVIEHEPESGTFRLPAEHAAWLTRASGTENFAVISQYIPVIASVENDVVDCFRKGGGVPYSRYARFHEVMAEDSGQTVLAMLIDVTLPIIPGAIEALRLGIDVLDIGCGRGRALQLMAKTFPNSRFRGLDLSPEAIAKARQDVAEAGLDNLEFEIRDLTSFDRDAPEAAYDLITAFDAIHDQARPDNVLAGIHRALRKGGTFFMQDIKGSSLIHENKEHPLGPLLYTISTMHCMTVSLAAGGMGLGTMWGRQKALEMLDVAGFRDVEIKELDHDIQNYYYIAKK